MPTALRQEQRQQTLAAIELLPETQRLALVLRHLGHQEPEEIGKLRRYYQSLWPARFEKDQ